MRWCPSAPATDPEGVVFGIVGGTPEEPRVGYLERALPIDEDILGLVPGVEPTEVLRIAAPCAEHACQHFSGHHCRLGERLADAAEPVILGLLPACQIRSVCRWHAEQGKAVCLRCPGVVTTDLRAPPAVREAATP